MRVLMEKMCEDDVVKIGMRVKTKKELEELGVPFSSNNLFYRGPLKMGTVVDIVYNDNDEKVFGYVKHNDGVAVYLLSELICV